MIAFKAGSIYVMDRGYIDFARLYRIHRRNAGVMMRGVINRSNIQMSKLGFISLPGNDLRIVRQGT
ncbi:MAG TPA: hypothetical protein VNQ90_00875, partial [Chthoniobacteraceae bacterium]|nr:hypothetical protein [Chthoniobacteraceae bacterium]